MKPVSFDKEKIHINLARIRKGGEIFEVAIDSDKAVEFKEGKNVDIREVLQSEQIFSDAKKGLLAAEASLETLFNTKDVLEIAKLIMTEGEIQFTAEYRNKLKESKRKNIINQISKFGVDPKTNLPHPAARIEAAIEEARVNVNLFKSAKQQVNDIIKEIRPILPIKLCSKQVNVQIPAIYAGKSYPILKNYGDLKSENWLNDGSLSVDVVVPAGMINEFFEKLNSLTQGTMESKIIKEE
ncbi:ribosome assembly factor SBDS [Candidatus Woesearchaeota archaeon]|nr:ribosome assembly factor SBDS [Candidatus Woesearchaeota archaeon]